MSVGYYKTMLAYGVKLMVTLLLAGIGLAFFIMSRPKAVKGGVPTWLCFVRPWRER